MVEPLLLSNGFLICHHADPDATDRPVWSSGTVPAATFWPFTPKVVKPKGTGGLPDYTPV